MHDLFGSVDNVADFVRITKTCCIRHSIGTLNQYMDGKKHCRRCETYFYYNGLFCPCCGMQLRKTPPTKGGKEKLRRAYIDRTLKGPSSKIRILKTNV